LFSIVVRHLRGGRRIAADRSLLGRSRLNPGSPPIEDACEAETCHQKLPRQLLVVQEVTRERLAPNRFTDPIFGDGREQTVLDADVAERDGNAAALRRLAP